MPCGRRGVPSPSPLLTPKGPSSPHPESDGASEPLGFLATCGEPGPSGGAEERGVRPVASRAALSGELSPAFRMSDLMGNEASSVRGGRGLPLRFRSSSAAAGGRCCREHRRAGRSQERRNWR
ncbi:protein of unknown function (plasmid) [Streptantibioticus cattleyicolor NRRL 8057 = DSM 46488]|nr:protein of unknown function [Streptantibioticus cattleyicolor NRRL 8057 = DSM 46488]